MKKTYISPEEAGRITGTSRRTIRRCIDNNTLKAKKVRSHWEIDIDDLEKFTRKYYPVEWERYFTK